MSQINFIIISGTSGSGKTIALQVLEDLGFYCIDNLPASLIPEMAARALNSESDDKNIAVSIDSRNRDFIGDLKSHFDNLSELGIEYRVIFLDADDGSLLKRYSETRRKHPLSNEHTSLSEAIARERELLEHISDVAHQHINTSNTTPHELRSQIRNFAVTGEEKSLTLLFQSFGFKYGLPTDADFVFDVRCLPNPYWDVELRPLTGLDQEVHDFLAEQAECREMFTQIRNFTDYWLPHFAADNRNYITVAIGCTGGRHRSVFLSKLLCQHFSQQPQPAQFTINTQLRHREINV